MRPIGDVDEDDLALSAGEDLPPEDGSLFETPPAIPELKRQLLLARLILERERDASAEQAVLLAQALARLLDQAQTERLSFDRLARPGARRPVRALATDPRIPEDRHRTLARRRGTERRDGPGGAAQPAAGAAGAALGPGPRRTIR